MKKLSLIILISAAVNSAILAQDSFLTKTGYVQFFSTTPVEDIKSENYKVVSRLNTKTGEIVFSIPIQSFEFENALMQKHFNSKNFMDSKMAIISLAISARRRKASMGPSHESSSASWFRTWTGP